MNEEDWFSDWMDDDEEADTHVELRTLQGYTKVLRGEVDLPCYPNAKTGERNCEMCTKLHEQRMAILAGHPEARPVFMYDVPKVLRAIARGYIFHEFS